MASLWVMFLYDLPSCGSLGWVVSTLSPQDKFMKELGFDDDKRRWCKLWFIHGKESKER
jgi:hypothetical protein